MGGTSEAQVRSAQVHKGMEVSDATAAWRCLPDWLQFFFDLGQRVAVAHENGHLCCAVVAPPVRSYAAAFIATGAVVGVATSTEAVPDVETHFGSLAQLEKGTPLVVRNGEQIYAATFRGTTVLNGLDYVMIEYEGMTHYLPKDDCHRAQVGSGGRRSLPRMLRSTSSRSQEAVEQLLGESASEFLSIPTADVVLVGKVSLLEQELTGVRIRASGRGTGAELRSLLRPNRLLPEGGIHRSLLLSDRVSEFSMPVEDVPHVVVFDGPRALARHRSQFQDSSWVAVLDRCSTSFREGVEVANAEFAMRRGSVDPLNDLDVPAGTEVQVFERAK